jgi:hypothetical protein
MRDAGKNDAARGAHDADCAGCASTAGHRILECLQLHEHLAASIHEDERR